MKCKLTQTDGKGVDAHIIPRSFYAIDPDEPKQTRLITNREGHYPKRCPIGIYDNTIVTEEGEKVFSEWDRYAAELLIDKKASFEPCYNNNELVAFQIKTYDYTKLKLFFLSVLWRASVSSHNFFRRVNLGPHEVAIRQALIQGIPRDTHWFSVSIAKWSDHPNGAGMMDPHRTRFNGLNYYVMYLEHYIIYFKVDGRAADITFQSTQLKPDSPLIVVSRELNSSKELKVLQSMVRNDAVKS